MSDIQKVVITNVDIKFFNMVFLMVKYAFAAIPALIIIGTISSMLWFGVFAVIMKTFG